MRTLQDEAGIIDMCLPIRDHGGGMWFGRNQNMADATFVDHGACRAFATAARALPELLKVVTELANAGQPEATSRLRQMAKEALALTNGTRGTAA